MRTRTKRARKGEGRKNLRDHEERECERRDRGRGGGERETDRQTEELALSKDVLSWRAGLSPTGTRDQNKNFTARILFQHAPLN